MFEFKPGSRWGQTKAGEDPNPTANPPKDSPKREEKREFTLRGPHEGKKNVGKVVDEKKLALAKSLFGKKK